MSWLSKKSRIKISENTTQRELIEVRINEGGVHLEADIIDRTIQYIKLSIKKSPGYRPNYEVQFKDIKDFKNLVKAVKKFEEDVVLV